MFDPFHRDNHYLPRMYLKPWATAGGQVWTYRILVAHGNVPMWKLFSSKSVAHHEHLYTQLAAGKQTDEIERWFEHDFETPAEEPIEKVLSNGRLTPDDWKRLVRFLAAQDVRTPASFAKKMKRWDESLPSLLKDMNVQIFMSEFVSQCRQYCLGENQSLVRDFNEDIRPMIISQVYVASDILLLLGDANDERQILKPNKRCNPFRSLLEVDRITNIDVKWVKNLITCSSAHRLLKPNQLR